MNSLQLSIINVL